jgi:Phospholipase A2
MMAAPGFTAEFSAYGPGRQYRQLPSAAAATEELGLAQIPIYGNWCGPGHSGPGAPIDPVDRVCCLHDHCYGDRGTLDCACDRDLVARMPGAIADTRTSAAGRAAGTAAAAFFAVSPCLCNRVCFPFVGCTDTPVPAPGIGKFCPPPFA